MIDKEGIKIAVLSYCVRELECKIRRKGKNAGPAYFTKTRAMEEIKELKKVNFCRTFCRTFRSVVRRCSSKFRKFHRKTPVLELLVAGLFLQNTSGGCFCTLLCIYWIALTLSSSSESIYLLNYLHILILNYLHIFSLM